MPLAFDRQIAKTIAAVQHTTAAKTADALMCRYSIEKILLPLL